MKPSRPWLCVALTAVALGCAPTAEEGGNPGTAGSGSARGGSSGARSGGTIGGAGSGTGGSTGGSAGGTAGSAAGTGGAGNTGGTGGSGGNPAPDGGSAEAGPMGAGGAGSGTPGTPIGDGLTQLLVSRGIGLGYYHACHILDTMKVKCFGTADPRNRPPADVAAAKVDQIFCAHNGCCALMPEGSAKRLSCWSHKATFYPPNTGIDPIHFGIGYDHGCAVNKDNTVRCWGQGPGPESKAPAGLKAKSLAVASFFNCAVLMDDTVQCWGTKAPQPPAGLKVKLVAAIYHGNLRQDNDDITKGTSHACGIKLEDDTLVCWGDNIEGTTDVPPNLGKVRDVAVASWNTCAVKLDGEPVCWGTKRYNSSPERFHPQPMGLRLKGIRAKLATYCGLKLDNTMACWGDESNVHITIEPPTQKFFTTP